MLLLAELFQNGFTLLLPILNVLDSDLFFLNRYLLLKCVQLLVLNLLFIVQFIHSRRIDPINLVFQRCDMLTFIVSITDLRFELFVSFEWIAVVAFGT